MKVLVTGVTGLIGTALSRGLSEAGHTVKGLSRDPLRAHQRLPWLEQVYEWDSMTSPPPAEAFSEVDAVVHLAGERITVRPNAAKMLAVLESRRNGTRNIVEGLRLASPKPSVFISASAIGYYGDHGDDEVTEETSPGNKFLAEVCQSWEVEALQARELGLRVVVIRLGIVLGAGGGALAPLLRLTKLGFGGPLGSGKQWWAWIHLEDIVGLIKHALEQPVEGVMNATAPQPVRQQEFARVLGRLLHRPAIIPAPAFALKLGMGEMATEVLWSRRILPQRALDSGYQFRFPELEPALRQILSSAKSSR